MKSRDYYRGISYPIISNSIINGILFPVYNYSLEKTNNNTIISGMIAGVTVSPIIYAFDMGKVLRQVQKPITLSIFRGLPGIQVTFGREMMAFSVYFTSYDYFKNKCEINPFISGGLAGLVNWTTTYPLDVIRNRQIAQKITATQAFNIGKLWKGYPICALRSVILKYT
jgi:hypothetical protein